ncbi:helix-turn-helix domain-containing protein [Bacillus cereus]|uniref:Uncharacterized protein n=2 Tax=Bacillus cereus group TaxID=86661 RepID=R8Q0M2_BACCE|nr:helix-turn-helix domain-containing protein [Bacillus cereus]EOP64636.1 hypothetical protein IIQ_03353 [Bacillus cereus VD118]MCQ6358297.1 helix-turn-helix domain-containing protein [Bacillus cereus]SCB70432.1 Uncharacterized protein BWGO95_04602 [Bacillus mycoides]
MTKEREKERREQQKALRNELKAIKRDSEPNPLYDKEDKENGVDFIKMPATILEYLSLNEYGFNADSILIYQIIINWYNRNEGAAYPSQYAVARVLKKSVPTVKKHIALLEEVGLIEIERRGLGRTNLYKPLRPLERHALLDRYPRASKFDIEFSQHIEEYKTKDMQRVKKDVAAS